MSKKKAKLPLSKTHPKLAKEAHGWDPKTLDSSSGKESNGNAYSVTLGARN